MNGASHSVLRPAAGLIALLRHWTGLDRTAQSSKSPEPTAGPASANAETARRNLAGRWPDPETLLAHRFPVTHSNATSSGKSDQTPAE